jgi:hypothetical protein
VFTAKVCSFSEDPRYYEIHPSVQYLLWQEFLWAVSQVSLGWAENKRLLTFPLARAAASLAFSEASFSSTQGIHSPESAPLVDPHTTRPPCTSVQTVHAHYSACLLRLIHTPSQCLSPLPPRQRLLSPLPLACLPIDSFIAQNACQKAREA